MIVLISISLNRSLLLNVFDAEIRTIILICVLAIFVLGLATYYLGRKLSSEIDAIDYSLYVTQKNEATGLAMAILMFNSTVAIPLIIALVVQFLYFIVFERFVIKVE
jgi:predicted Na+-dependent transporter